MATERAASASPRAAAAPQTTRSPRGWAIALVLAAFALRGHALGAKSLWYDELRQVEVAQQPLADLTPFLLLHAGRPLDYLVTHALLPFGRQEYWLRAPALLWGTLSVAVLYALARRWLGGRAALWTTALFAASPFAVEYAQELRPYALYLLLALLGMWSLDRALTAPGPPRWAWPAFALTAVLGTLTHFFYAVVLTAQVVFGLAALAWPPRPPGWRGSLAALAGAGLAGLLALQVAANPVHLLQFAESFASALTGATTRGALVSDSGVEVRVSEAINTAFFLRGLLPALGAGPSLAALLVLNGLALLGLAALARRDRRRLVLILLWLAAAPAVVVLYLQFRQQFFALRYIIFALPPYLLLVGAGLKALGEWRGAGLAARVAGGVALAALLGLSLREVWAGYREPKDDWRRVGAFLAANVRPGDTLGAPDVQAFIRFYAPGQPAAIVDSSARGPHEQALLNGERFWFVWSDYTLFPVDDTRDWVRGLRGVTIQLDPRIRVIFVHPGRTQAEMLEEAAEFVIPVASGE